MFVAGAPRPGWTVMRARARPSSSRIAKGAAGDSRATTREPLRLGLQRIAGMKPVESPQAIEELSGRDGSRILR